MVKLSQIFADFDSEVTVAVPYLIANALRLGVFDSQKTEAGNFLSDWTPKYGLYKHPATHTSQSVTDIQDLYHLFHPNYNGLKQQIKNNRGVKLTGLDITTLHIHVDAPHRNHIPAPTFAPNNTVIQSTHLVSKIFTYNPNSPHQKETAMPTDVSKIGRKLAVVAATAAAPGPEQYHNLATVGATTYDLVFDPAQQGAKAYLITWYENNRGEAGPPSVVLSFIIN